MNAPRPQPLPAPSEWAPFNAPRVADANVQLLRSALSPPPRVPFVLTDADRVFLHKLRIAAR